MKEGLGTCIVLASAFLRVLRYLGKADGEFFGTIGVPLYVPLPLTIYFLGDLVKKVSWLPEL